MATLLQSVRRRRVHLLLLLCLILAALALTGRISRAGEADPSWWLVQSQNVGLLLDAKNRLSDLAAKAATLQPAGTSEGLSRLDLLLRAGLEKEAAAAVRRLKELQPELPPSEARSIYYDMCDHYQAWEPARVLLETCEARVNEISLDNRLIKHWQNEGWDYEKIDNWLAARVKGAAADPIPRRRVVFEWYQQTPLLFWMKQRLQFSVQQGKAPALIEQYVADVRKTAAGPDEALNLLQMLSTSGLGTRDKWNLSWVPELIKTDRALVCRRAGELLVSVGRSDMAEVYCRKAVELPVTDDEVTEMGGMMQIMLPPETIRKMFSAQVREDLSSLLLKKGARDEAQKWMVEAQDIREKSGLRRNALFAGMVQGVTGQRVIEGRIKEEEKLSADKPEYWIQRADYYKGRGETGNEEEALRKGLALTTPKPVPERPGKGYSDWRIRFLQRIAFCLNRSGRIEELKTFLYGELQNAPPDSASSVAAARAIAYDYSQLARPGEEVLWGWLKQQPVWSYEAERLLWRMLESAPADAVGACVTRAEEMATRGHASRAFTLGWILNRMQRPARSLPLLKLALQRSTDKDLTERAAFTLLETYLDLNDAAGAEAIFPQAMLRLTPHEKGDWLARLSQAAMRAGDSKNALRLWKRAANLNLTNMDALDRLARSGLKKELVEFYAGMQQELPTSVVPQRALALLNKP